MNSKLPMISMIAAIGSNRELGYGNELIWKIPADMARFKKITSGHPIIMGRKTFESIGRLLPNRTNIIVTRDPDFKVDGAVITGSIKQAIEEGKKVEDARTRLRQGFGGQGEIFIIGGAQIYNLAMPYADKLYLTKINSESPMADAFFPDYSEFKKRVFSEKHTDDSFEFEFIDLAR